MFKFAPSLNVRASLVKTYCKIQPGRATAHDKKEKQHTRKPHNANPSLTTTTTRGQNNTKSKKTTQRHKHQTSQENKKKKEN
jgi:hypothetical protein